MDTRGKTGVKIAHSLRASHPLFLSISTPSFLYQLWGQYYRDVLKNPDGDDHQNIRNFMKYGWEGVPFENGIALTRKQVGETEWDEFAESWIP